MGWRAEREEGKRAGEWDRGIKRKRDEWEDSGIQKGKAVTEHDSRVEKKDRKRHRGIEKERDREQDRDGERKNSDGQQDRQMAKAGGIEKRT